MADGFDPYDEWLGIPPEHQPADFYRLLGVDRFEGDIEFIAKAADTRIRQLGSLKGGEHSKEADSLFKKLSAAKACLTDPGKKKSL